MFTGIIEELGSVDSIQLRKESAVLRVHADHVLTDCAVGSSVAVDGVCLTVVDHGVDTFAVDVMAETLRRTTLGFLRTGSVVNLERAMHASSRFGGHVVQGHVDAASEILSREPGEQWEVVTFALPEAIARYVVEKGSIAVDGVSLTVSALGSHAFSVSLIPTTLALTTLGSKAVGASVNPEADIVAKYVERLLASESQVPS